MARHGNQASLIPPLDVAWIWHVHRLAPLLYAEYCNKNFGKVLNAHTPFLAQNMHTTDRANAEKTQRLWEQHNPGTPMCFDPLVHGVMSFDSNDQDFVLGRYNVAEACSRQQKFLTSVSTPLFTSHEFLTHAIKQYCQFLLVCRTGDVMVPSVPIDLVWHTHQLLSSTNYIAETTSMLGYALNHNDNLEQELAQEHPEQHACNDLEQPFLVNKSTLQTQWNKTKKVWGEMFHETMGTSLTVPICIEQFISSKNSELVLNQLSAAGECGSLVQPQVVKTSALVPKSWKEVIRRAMFSEKGQAGQDVALASLDSSLHAFDVKDAARLEPLPVVVKTGSTDKHQDRLGGTKKVVDAFVAILYLKGSGTMKFQHVCDASQNYEVEIRPFSLLFFPNKQYTHEFIAHDNEETRIMLGPFSFMGEDVVRVGDCGGGCGGDCSGCGSSGSGSSDDGDCGQLFCMCILIPYGVSGHGLRRCWVVCVVFFESPIKILLSYITLSFSLSLSLSLWVCCVLDWHFVVHLLLGRAKTETRQGKTEAATTNVGKFNDQHGSTTTNANATATVFADAAGCVDGARGVFFRSTIDCTSEQYDVDGCHSSRRH